MEGSSGGGAVSVSVEDCSAVVEIRVLVADFVELVLVHVVVRLLVELVRVALLEVVDEDVLEADWVVVETDSVEDETVIVEDVSEEDVRSLTDVEDVCVAAWRRSSACWAA
jgi:hypothetical protein